MSRSEFPGTSDDGNSDFSNGEFRAKVRRQLQRILASQEFFRSPQAARLLSFIVERTLLATDDPRVALKEYSIAVEVFGRPVEFNPTTDNIVRVEFRRVRSKLDQYYRGAGAGDPVVITIPKGSHIPFFREREGTEIDLSGQTISHYQLLRRRCINRFQSTYDARCTHLLRPAIVIIPTKLVLEDPARKGSLLQETQAASVHHPGVSRVHDLDWNDDRILLAIDDLPPTSLSQHVGPMSEEETLIFARELAGALASGHSVGVVHGNLTPYSVYVEKRNGNAPFVSIMPFGIFALVDINHETFEGFRPPEWRSGLVNDLRSDVWSFGALVWFASYGRPPALEVGEMADSDRGRMSAQLEAIVRRCLSHELSERYRSGLELLEDITTTFPPPELGQSIDQLPSAALAQSGGRTLFLTSVLFAILLAGIVVSYLVHRNPGGSSPISEAAYDTWMKGHFAATEYWNSPLPSRFDEAERRLKRAIDLQPEYVDATVDLAQLYLSAAYPPKGDQKGLFEKAEKFAGRAVALAPNSGPAHAVLGSVYTDTGRTRMALPHLLRAVKLSPQDPIPHNYLSIAYEAMGFWESSLAERDEALKRDPLLEGIWIGRALMLARLGRLPEAYQSEKSRGNDKIRLAYLDFLSGDPRRAEETLKQAPMDAGDRELGLLLALVQSAQERPEIAKAAVKRFATNERTRNERYILLCAIAGDRDRLVEEIAKHTYRRSYRWVASEALLRPYRRYPPFQKLTRTLYSEWKRDLAEFGSSLPVAPPVLLSADEYLNQL